MANHGKRRHLARERHEGVRANVLAVDAVDLEIGEGEFMVLVGPSGCGKSTLLRLIAGLEEATGGDDHDRRRRRDATPPAGPRHRDGLPELRAVPAHDRRAEPRVRAPAAQGRRRTSAQRRVHEAARTLGLDELLDRKPAALSGGQRQRVAIGRAMVREPVAFLMDEPLSNLDAKLRVSMRASLARLHEQLGVTTVYVTHDQVEAMTLGQRVAVMRDGRVQQVDTPQNLFNQPANLFVAAFIGSPSMNLVEADVGDGAIRFAGHVLALPDRSRRRPDACSSASGRPTSRARAGADPSLPRMRVRAAVVEELGAESHVIFHVDAPRVHGRRGACRRGRDADEETLFADDERAEFTARSTR